MPLGLKFKAWLGHQMIFRPADQPDRLAAPAPGLYRRRGPGPELFTFYQAIGVNLKQIYGQTEIVGIAYMHRDGDVRPDTVGKPLPNTECKISEEGEILSRSPSVTPGYLQAARQDGRTAGRRLAALRRCRLHRRKRPPGGDRPAGGRHAQCQWGEMFSPMFLENKLKFSPYIKEAVIFRGPADYVPP
jgi:long-chain acyl-CoA synthetase